MTHSACPVCAQGMESRPYSRKPSGRLELDICWTCQGIWFDPYESTALTPGAVLQLFHEIDANSRTRPQRSLETTVRCPVCNEALKLSHDVQRTNKFTYWRCEHGHGRFTTFYQFLREKNFVRSLTLGEIERLKANVQQVKCSSCGGAVNLEREMACSYCHAPLSILDADAVKKTIDELSEAERRRQYVDPNAVIDALFAGQEVERRVSTYAAAPRGEGLKRQLAEIAERHRDPSGSADPGVDLVQAALRALMKAA